MRPRRRREEGEKRNETKKRKEERYDTEKEKKRREKRNRSEKEKKRWKDNIMRQRRREWLWNAKEYQKE